MTRFLALSSFIFLINLCQIGCKSEPNTNAQMAMATTDAGLLDAAAVDGEVMVDATQPGRDATVADATIIRNDAAPDPTEAVYERTRLLQIDIEMDAEQWDELRSQRRYNLDILAPECRLPDAPYTWFSARVSIDGKTYEDVGIRKKGFFGSLSRSKPSLKLKFDKFIDGQEFEGMERLTLNNSKQDQSFVRQCLAYDLFREAGIPASRCNFARVIVNGTDLGAYVNIESIKKAFLRRHFSDDEGLLYEGTLSDFRANWTGTFDQKTQEDAPNSDIIDAISAALELPDDQLLEALSGPLDLDAFLTFWAVEILVAHWDGYSGNTNNYFFYVDPETNKAHFIPWGTDGTFIPPLMYFERRLAPRSVNASGRIARRLYRHPMGRQMYLDKLESLLDALWDVNRLEASIEEMVMVFGEAVRPESLRDTWAKIDETLAFVQNQGPLIRAEIEEGPIQWDFPERGSLCQEQNGSSSGQFSTTWGSWPTPDTFQTGTGMVSLTLAGEPFAVRAVGAAIGLDEDDPNVGQLIIPILLEDDSLLFHSFNLPVEQIQAGLQKDLSDGDVNCGLYRYNAGTRQVTPAGVCRAGTLSIDEGSREQGALVRGRFETTLWSRASD